MTRHTHRYHVATSLLLTALLWCGSMAEAAPLTPAGSPMTLAAVDPSREDEIVVKIRARQFLPTTVKVRAGRHTKLVFRNLDAELHAFVPGTLFEGINLNVSGNGAPEFGENGLRRIIIPPEGRAELRFVLEQPGRYPFICDMPGHDMRATIVVE